jgi:Fic family protein
MTCVLFRPPPIGADLQAQLTQLDELRERLHVGDQTAPGRWEGTLRRLANAENAVASTSIEGYTVSLGDAQHLLAQRALSAGDDEDRQAVQCYGRAMDHVLAMADDRRFAYSTRVLLDLHFDACYFQPDQGPGRWRAGPMGVTSSSGGILYTAPAADAVPSLMEEVADWLQRGDLDAHVVVRAAMAHLHVASVHPFRDGNGRLSRIVQSLVLALDGYVAPEFASIEGYLAAHTQAYYAALHAAQGDAYDPTRDATPWLRFALDAHIDQARRRLAQIEEATARWSALESLAEQRGWPDRFVIALEQAVTGGLDRAGYQSEADVSPATATTDLARLGDAGLLSRRGRGPSTAYEATDALRQLVRHPAAATTK